MVNFTYQRTERGAVVATTVNGVLHLADDTHPSWTGILRELRKGDFADESRLETLFNDSAGFIREDLAKYTDRITIRNEKVYLDGEEAKGRLPQKIVQVYNKNQSPRALVLFLENLSDNPSHRSREQLFTYLEKHDFQITEDGCFIAYKGLGKDEYSIHSGKATVDGTEIKGRIPNREGSVITMPRSEISDDPNVACHAGLHAGTYSYASGFGRGVTAKVKVNPKHVVSVPADSNTQKIRTEQYEVLQVDIVAPNDEQEVYEAYEDWDEAYDAGFDDGYWQGQADAENGDWV